MGTAVISKRCEHMKEIGCDVQGKQSSAPAVIWAGATLALAPAPLEGTCSALCSAWRHSCVMDNTREASFTCDQTMYRRMMMMMGVELMSVMLLPASRGCQKAATVVQRQAKQRR